MRIGTVWRHPLVAGAALSVALLTLLMSAAGAAATVLKPGPPIWVWYTPLGLTTGATVLAGRFRTYAAGAGLTATLLTLPGWPLVLPVLAIAAVWYWRRPDHNAALFIGRTRFGRPVCLAAPDRLLHAHILGPTGSGKSTTVLLPWMRQDVAAGRSFTLIEPKGDLCEAVASLARQHPGLLLRVDPTRATCPHINMLAGDGAAAGEGLALALEQVEPSGHPFYRTVSRVVLVQIVRAVVASRGEAASPADLMKALRDPAWRARLVREARLEDVEAYLSDDLGRLAPARQQELTLGLANRLQSLLMHPGLQRLWSPPYDISLSELVQEQPAWLLASFPVAELGRGASACGTLLWHLVVRSVYAAGPQAVLRQTLYLDEFHQYVSPDLNDVLAMVRGYGLAVVLAHQDMAQLTPDLKAAVAANARSHLILGGGPADDAARFQREAAPYAFPAVRYLPRGRAVYLGTHDGRAQRPTVVHLPRPPAAR